MFIEDVDNVKMSDLLDTLVIFTKLYHKPFSAEALTAGLPIEPGKEAPELFSIKSSKGLFSRAAARAGLKSSIFHKPLKQISPLQLPVILLLSNQGACILDSFNKDKTKAKIYMPSDEPVAMWVDIEDLEDQYIGYGFLVKKDFEHDDTTDKTLHTHHKHWFWHTIKLSTGIYKDALLASFLINLFVLASPLFTMNVYDRVVPNNAIETLWMFAIGVFVVYAIDIFAKFTRTYLLEMAAKKSDIIMSSIIFEKVLSLKLSSFPASVGSLANHIRDFENIRNFLTNATIAAIIDLPFTVIFLVTIAYIGGSIVIFPVITVLVILGYTLYLRKPLKESIESTQDAASKKNAILIETLQNIETLKSLGTLNQIQWKWEEAVGEIAKKGLKSRLLSASIPTVTQFLIQLNTVMTVVYGVYLISDFKLTMGGLIAVVILSGRALAPMSQVASLISNYETTKQSYEAINNIISEPSERPEGKQFVETPKFEGSIEFIDVTFTYPNSTKPSLKNVSFKINPKEHVAFIGKIGSGKSTILKLILGLYEPDSGQILIDGIDINQIDPADLRKHIGYVSQDIHLFRGTAKENIVFRATHVSDGQMVKAATISGAHEFIKTHPKGYDMPIGERGLGLSGGQKQTLGIARAFLFDTPIMLLDEPTGSMDQVTENKLIKNLKEALKNKTTVMVTQKMGLLELADRVIVMHDGKVVIDDKKEDALKKLQGGHK